MPVHKIFGVLIVFVFFIAFIESDSALKKEFVEYKAKNLEELEPCAVYEILSKKNIIASILAFFISLIGYYFANKFIFGSGIAFATSFLASAVQGVGSAIIYILISSALDKSNVKNRLFKL